MKVNTLRKVEIPKPKPLIGGGNVYQNDDVPYWYCDLEVFDSERYPDSFGSTVK